MDFVFYITSIEGSVRQDFFLLLFCTHDCTRHYNLFCFFLLTKITKVILQIMTSSLVRSTCRRVPSYLILFHRNAATAPLASTPVTPESLINEQRPQSKESKEHQTAKTERLTPTASTKVDKKVKTSNSFVMNLFRGQFYPNEVFPYPNVLNEEQKENVKMLLDPISKFFEEKNDPGKNDQAEQVK